MGRYEGGDGRIGDGESGDMTSDIKINSIKMNKNNKDELFSFINW